MTSEAPDEWLYSEQAAEICGITPAAWRRAALSTPARLATARVRPEEYRRHPQDGRPQWSRRCVERYRDRPERNTVTEGQATHRAILAQLAIAGGTDARASVAARLGLHLRTIDRHLDGICACNLPTVPA